ncbi:MAG: energy transducer TonB [Bacteroidota bacterium]
MKISHPFLSFILCLASLLVHAQQSFAPGIHEYIYVEQEPEAINLQEIRDQIGYPVSAQQSGIEGTILCRVLVDQEGNYQQHKITRADHPLLRQAVEPHINSLQFSPAVKGQEHVSFWVNVPFYFKLINIHEKASKDYHQLYRDGVEYYEKGALHTAKAFFDRVIELTSKKKKATDIRLRSFSYRSKVASRMRNWEEAHHDLSQAITLVHTIGSTDNEQELPRMYLTRALLRLRINHTAKAADDFNWVMRMYPDFSAPESLHLLRIPMGNRDLKAFLAGLEHLRPNQPNNPYLYFYQAWTMGKLGHVENARKLYQIASQHNNNPTFQMKAINASVYTCYKAGEYGPALSACMEALQFDGPNPLAHYYRGLILREIGNEAEAKESLETALQDGLSGQEKALAESMLEE